MQNGFSVVSVQASPGEDARRRWHRYEIDMRVKVRVLINGTAQMWQAQAHDINEGGMALMVPFDLSIGSFADLEFTLPYSRMKMLVKASVRNKSGFRYGFEFLTISPAQRDELNRVFGVLSLHQNAG